MLIERYQSQQEQRKPEPSGTQEGNEYAQDMITRTAQNGASHIAGAGVTVLRHGGYDYEERAQRLRTLGSRIDEGDYRLRKNSAEPEAGREAVRDPFFEGPGGAEVPAQASGASPAREAGRDLVVGRYARDQRRAREAGWSGARIETVPAEAQRSVYPGGTATAGAAKTGQTAWAPAAAQSVQKASKSGRSAAKPRRAVVKAGSRPVMTAHTATKAAKKAQQSAKTAKIAAQRAAKAAKQSAEAAKKTARFTVRVVSAMVRGLVLIFSGGLGVLLPILLIVALVAALASSPFGIFFSGQDSGPNVKPLLQIVAETNAELDARIDQIKANHDGVAEISITYDGSEDNTVINNWPDVVSVFAVKTALAGSNAADVVTLDAGREAQLKAVFWDMTQIDSWEEEQTRTRKINDGHGKIAVEMYTCDVLCITVTSLDYHEGAALYGFNANQISVLEDMTAPDNMLFLMELLGPSGPRVLTATEITAIRERLVGLTLDRQDLVTAALSLEGKVSYFWGGKSTAIGWDDRWGAPMTVTAAGSKSTGTIRPFGLDCSGFVAWSFSQIGVSPDIIGWGTADQWAASAPISWSDAQPGDLAFFAIPGTLKTNHVGIIVGVDAAGGVLVVHCNSSRNTVSVTEAKSTGFKYLRRPIVFD